MNSFSSVSLAVAAMPKQNFYYVGDCGPGYHIECKIAYWLWRVAPFVLLFIGTLGNIFNIVVLTRKQLRKYSTATFLLFLAVTELTVLWMSLIPETIIGITGKRLVDQSSVTCRLRWWLALTSGSFSTWILVLLTIERTLRAKAPVFSKSKLTPRNALIVSIATLAVIAVLNSHMVFGVRLYDIPTSDVQGQNDTESQSSLICSFSSVEYETFYFRYWFVIVLTVYNIVPACLIISGNINIGVVLILQRRKLAKVHPLTQSSERNHQKAVDKLLFGLSAYYVLTTTPWCVYNIIRGKVADHSEKGLAQWQLATAVVNILVWSNFSFNFFFYFVGGTLFKNEWKRLVKKTRVFFQKKRKSTTTTREIVT